ncbi:hypothetical protein PCCS19_34850 [Paenibacillus sp. CCS19]|uniref:hypothetical protein n=1 Tax=Paenibacillus sp. CCS19 TaxID=3158387 RepID=UPI0025640C11|nr:hypothetical protein [Paenibacillus cellulosilyticus]GMK40429.1 hypothetical protein PCCS19_34850 [Paenibacillus cellulosilyticus]
MKNIIIALIAMCCILTGCSSNQTEKQPVIVKDKEKSVTENENNLTLDKVTTALKSVGIEMVLEEQQNDWVLHNVKPNRFSVVRPNVKEVYKEYISIYVYNSEAARKKGLTDFKNQKEKYNMQIPNIFEYKNVLILYWHHETVDNAKDTKFNKQIEMAIQKI